MSSSPTTGLVNLPAELISNIVNHLDYPDLLSLHLVHPRFFYSPLLNTDNDAGIRLRVAWVCSMKSYDSLLTPSYRPSRGSFALPLFSFRLAIPHWLLASSTSSEIARLRRKACTQVIFRTNAEFLMNTQVQQILWERSHHVACRQRDCRVVPGTMCSGPKLKSSRFVWGLPSLVLAMYKEMVMSMKEYEINIFLSGGDILLLFLVTLALSQVVQELARWLGRDLGVHSAGIIVLAAGAMFGKSLLAHSRAHPGS